MYDTYVRNPLVAENSFISMTAETSRPPSFDAARSLLPQPVWDGHEPAIACYWKVWELAFRNLCRATPANGFIANYIDTAFNDCIFMWDTAFILLFARYGRRAFDFLRTLDNFYCKQHPDGFICREIGREEGDDRFERFDPTSTGPNIFPWTEWEHYLNFGDADRLARVFPVLRAYHQWLRQYRAWPDGSYWSSGWGCGMDNQPRVEGGYHVEWSHGHMVWADACFQQILSANLLATMGAELGRSDEVADMREESQRLTRFVNECLWDDATAYYYDRFRDGRLNGVKSVGAYWALLAEAAPAARLPRFIEHLANPAEFNRPHRLPALSADHPAYDPEGGAWCGGVWPPTNYMVLRGLTLARCHNLAHAIAVNHVGNVTQAFQDTGTVWEFYAPESAGKGHLARSDLVGWSGLGPIAVLFEYVFGLRADVRRNTLVWDVRLLDAHGVDHYPFGPEGLLDLRCTARIAPAEKPEVTIRSNVPVAVELLWRDGAETIAIG